MTEWPVINSPDDLPEDGRYDRMYAEWLVADNVILPEDLELQVRLTRARRRANLMAREDLERRD